MPPDKSFLDIIVMPLLVMEQTILPKRYRIIETCSKNKEIEFKKNKNFP